MTARRGRIAPATPPTSLIVCSRNRPRLLLDTVESILQGDEVPAELVIVDQSEEPHPRLPSLATDRPCAIRYVPTPSVGLGRARNAGIAAARHEVLAFLDDDMWVATGWFGALIRALVAAGPRSVVTGQVRAAPPEVPGGIAPSIMVGEARAVYEGRVGRDVLAAGNMALHRSAIAEIGLFDERLGAGARFPSSEDNDFGFRLLEAGYRIVYEPAALCHHRAWRAAGAYLKLRWSYGRGQGGFYAKHLRRDDRYMLRRAGADVLRRARQLPGRVRRRQLRLLWGDAVYVLGVAAGAAAWWLAERSSR